MTGRPPTPPAQRFWTKVDKAGPVPEHRPDLGPCWLWTAATVRGYARFSIGYQAIQGHRWAWEEANGPIPAGLQLDHLCRVRHCVRPSHCEPVTNRENVLRGEGITARNAVKTHCKHGHPLSGDNLWIDRSGRNPVRRCRACIRRIQSSRDWGAVEERRRSRNTTHQVAGYIEGAL